MLLVRLIYLGGRDVLLYLGAGNRNGAIPLGYPEKLKCRELSMMPEFNMTECLDTVIS